MTKNQKRRQMFSHAEHTLRQTFPPALMLQEFERDFTREILRAIAKRLDAEIMAGRDPRDDPEAFNMKVARDLVAKHRRRKT